MQIKARTSGEGFSENFPTPSRATLEIPDLEKLLAIDSAYRRDLRVALTEMFQRIFSEEDVDITFEDEEDF